MGHDLEVTSQRKGVIKHDDVMERDRVKRSE